MTIVKRLVSIVGAVVIVSNFGLSKILNAEEYNPKGWPIPDIKNAKYYGDEKIDNIREINGKETILRIYGTSKGTYFNSLSIKDNDGNEKVYGYFVDTDGKLPMEYMLLDWTGNGIFEKKLKSSSSKETETPPWIKSLDYE